MVNDPYYTPVQNPPTVHSPTSQFPWKFILLGCGGLTGFGLLLVCGGFIYLLSGHEGGVRLSNEMEEYAVQHLEENRVLTESEHVIAYYDVTLTLDASEAAILTNERIIYFNNGQVTAIPLADITEIRHHTEPMIGEIIEIESNEGPPMKIEIAPFNRGETFINALQREWERSR